MNDTDSRSEEQRLSPEHSFPSAHSFSKLNSHRQQNLWNDASQLKKQQLMDAVIEVVITEMEYMSISKQKTDYDTKYHLYHRGEKNNTIQNDTINTMCSAKTYFHQTL